VLQLLFATTYSNVPDIDYACFLAGTKRIVDIYFPTTIGAPGVK
jgi:hypothetical protein